MSYHAETNIRLLKRHNDSYIRNEHFAHCQTQEIMTPNKEQMISTTQPPSPAARQVEPLQTFPPRVLPAGYLTRVTAARRPFSFYGTFDRDRLVAAATSYTKACTDADTPALSKIISDFLQESSHDCMSEAPSPSLATQACWLTIRVSQPSSEYVVPRWHRDGRMFDCSCQSSESEPDRKVPHSKYAVTLLGPATLLLASGQQHVDDTLAVRKWWRDEERKPLADAFAECERVTVQTGQMIRFSWGQDDSPVHSEPDFSVNDRVFMSVLYGSKEELRDMCEFRKVEYGKVEP